ncbi:MAG: phage major capsid protein [Tabrizicola sp.]
MSDITELKSLLEEGNRTIAALRSEVDGLKSQADGLDQAKIERIEADLAATLQQKAALEQRLTAESSRIAELEKKLNRPPLAANGLTVEDAEHKAALIDFMRKGAVGGAEAALYAAERKAADVRVATPASGGYALPKEIAAALNKQLLDISPIRGISRVVTVSTPDYHELVDLNGFGTEWLGETDTHNPTTTPDLADVAPTFGELSAYPKATRQAISDLMFDVEGWLIERGAEQMAKAEGIAFISGNGTNKPTGFLAGPAPVATADAGRAFGTLQYVPSGAAAALGANPYDQLKDMMYALKAGHRANAVWVMNSLTLAAHAKVKTTDGQYLLTPAVREGDPETLLGKRIVVAEDMPTIAANAFPIAFGDFRAGYLIADIPSWWILRDEITQPGYVKFPMSRRVGGKLLDTNAIKLLKIATT